METLYRKVQFEINEKDHDEIWLIGKSANFIFNPNTRNGEELTDFLSGCEEIPDNHQQIEKLQADKAELLEVLEKTKNEMLQCLKFLRTEGYEHMEFENLSEVIYTIQKHT